MDLSTLNELYNITDCYVSPYRAEGFNLTPLEAAASGTPIIVTKGGSTDDYFNPKFGLQIDSKVINDGNITSLRPNIESIVECILLIMKNPKDYGGLEVSKFTNFPEILEGRIKTLHPKIHAGILNKRNNKSHKKQMVLNKYECIDLVIVNFYPFEETLKKTKNKKKIIENIDIGGPTLVRSAAKNYSDVTVVTNIDQYSELIDELQKNKGSTSIQIRQKLSEEDFT